MDKFDDFEEIKLEQILDQTDKKTCVYSPHPCENRFIIVWNRPEPVKDRESYIITVFMNYDIRFDSRKPLINVTHAINYESGKMPKESHTLNFVLDPNNHGPLNQDKKQPFHLNLSGKSKDFILNNKCKKCKQYFLDMNHFPLFYDYNKKHGEYKFSNLDKTFNEFIKRLHEKDFFNEFQFGGEIKAKKGVGI